mmetsp:Transcript_11847/g.33382  ORF Transcript_11847/g.33382 Transcript_11847/m.33382 type:complete len:86 (-) Transcript_11847:1449-1706(-)
MRCCITPPVHADADFFFPEDGALLTPLPLQDTNTVVAPEEIRLIEQMDPALRLSDEDEKKALGMIAVDDLYAWAGKHRPHLPVLF